MAVANKGINAVFKTGTLLLVLAGMWSHGAVAAEWAPSERIALVSQSSPGTGNELMLRELADIWNKNKLDSQACGSRERHRLAGRENAAICDFSEQG